MPPDMQHPFDLLLLPEVAPFTAIIRYGGCDGSLATPAIGIDALRWLPFELNEDADHLAMNGIDLLQHGVAENNGSAPVSEDVSHGSLQHCHFMLEAECRTRFELLPKALP